MSAIQGMMSLLQQAPPGEYGESAYPGGLLQPTPSFAGPSKSPSMIDRIMDRFRPKAPAGYEGLLSPDEIESARPGLLQSLIGTPDAPSASQRYTDNLNNIVAVKQAAEQMRSQKQLGEARARIAAKHRLPENATRDQQIEALRGMMADYAAIGDHEMVGKMAGYMSGADKAATPGDDLEWVDMGGEKALVRKSTGEVVRREKKTPSPRDPNAPDTAALAREQKMFDRTNRLADDFRSETKMVAGAADQFRTLMSNVAAAKAGSPQAQIAMVFAFMKTLDPGSVVREGEYANAANAAGVPERVRNQYNKILAGSFLTPEQVLGFANQATETAKGWKRRQEGVARIYAQRARRWGINPDDVLLDYFEGIEESNPAAPTKSGGAVKSAIGGIR